MKSASQVKDFRIPIGRKISLLREEKQLTQLELGRKLGFTGRGTISQVESGKRSLKLESIIKAAKFFGVHPAVLISPFPIEDFNDFKVLSKVIYLIELKHEMPDLVKPLLRAIDGLLADLQSPY